MSDDKSNEYIKGIDDLISLISALPVGDDDDFHSHQEYADFFIEKIAEYWSALKDKKPTDEELVAFVHSTRKKMDWYENAVLRELGMYDHERMFNIQFIKNWGTQALIFEGKPVPYNFLLKIAYKWMEEAEENKFSLFYPNQIPEEDTERPSPPKPKWLKILEQPVPENVDYKTMLSFTKEYGTMATGMKDSFKRRHMAYYMACNQPELNDYNFLLLADKYQNESTEEFNSRIESYVSTYIEWGKEECNYTESIKNKFDTVLQWLETAVEEKVGTTLKDRIGNLTNMFNEDLEKDVNSIDFF